MPELPEVETTRRGLEPHLVGRRVVTLDIRQPRLRWPVANELSMLLPGQRIEAIERRAKYLLVHTGVGAALLHLGMSGCLRVLPAATPIGAHDHVDWRLDSGRVLRYTDPRRFGCQLWQAPGEIHGLLAGLGPEPLSDGFDGDLLWVRSRGRKAAVKVFVMDQAIVVGVGNIYAAEAQTRRRVDFASALRTPRARGEAHSRPRDSARWYHLARLHQSGWCAWLFRARVVCLRPRRRSVQNMRHANQGDHAGPAIDVLLSALPALSGVAHRVRCARHNRRISRANAMQGGDC